MNRYLAAIGAVVLGFVIWNPSIASAQQVSSFEQLQLLVKPGDKIKVIGADGKTTKGKIESLTPAALRLSTKAGTRDFMQKDAFEIKQKRGDSLGNGAVIGGITGGGIAGAALIACGDECGGEAGLVAAAIAIYAGIGIGIGVGIDALLKHDQTVYRQPAQAAVRSMRLEPLIASGRKGAVLRFSF